MRVFTVLLLLAGGLSAADPAEFFEMRVRPVLVKNCYACHTGSRLGGLEMDSRAALIKGGNSGPAIVPGKAEESLLIKAVAQTHERFKMPPSGKLKDEEIADLKAWIGAGAVWPETKPTQAAAPGKQYVIKPEQRAFWSFQPVKKSAPPQVKDKAWARTPIDAFILAKLEEKGLKPARPADKRTLIRRATFDLIGLPPKPEDVDAFLKDNSPDAFRKVVDRLLGSKEYGERWGRYWLDVARYSDDRLNSTNDDPYPNAFRYRDWVIQAFNDDMPYDLFVKAQIAGDLLPDKEKLIAGLGFYALSPEFQEDRVDATSRGFLGLTVACATCHDHKFDPIPTKDYYGMLGVFQSTKLYDYPLAPKDVVDAYDNQKKKVTEQELALKEFLEAQSKQLSMIFAGRASKYFMAARRMIGAEKENVFTVAAAEHLDAETLERLVRYLSVPVREHPYLKAWDALCKPGKCDAPEADLRKAANEFQEALVAVDKERKAIDQENLIRLGGTKDREKILNTEVLSLSRDKFFLWRDFYSTEPLMETYKLDGGVFRYSGKGLERFLEGEWKEHLTAMRADLDALKKAMPPEYPYLHTVQDVEQPKDIRVQIRGNPDNLGDEAPRRFLMILSDGEPKHFAKGSGRLELAEGIASASNPLTARVLVNRIWQGHFGQGIVRTPSNFGQLGERPTHPELLDYLAARFVENKWSIKSLHREMMLTAAYALSADRSEKNELADPENRLLWHFQRHRLDVEALRDSLLFAAGTLDSKTGGAPARLTEETNDKRTVYGFVSRRRLDGTLSLFDFANPNMSSEGRIVTNTPLQRLYFLNSEFIMRQAAALSARVAKEGGPDDAGRIRRAYRLLYDRDPEPREVQLGLEFLKSGEAAWPKYAQVLLSSNEFYFVN
ncbi:MAG: PSD1 domain-containing protein [Candidatus Solibacter usitatus]|nr:PSD1 domain-containing protein [Candidatus Solibacter usitatus]